MFSVVIGIWSVGDLVLTRRGLVVRAECCGAVAITGQNGLLERKQQGNGQ